MSLEDPAAQAAWVQLFDAAAQAGGFHRFAMSAAVTSHVAVAAGTASGAGVFEASGSSSAARSFFALLPLSRLAASRAGASSEGVGLRGAGEAARPVLGLVGAGVMMLQRVVGRRLANPGAQSTKCQAAQLSARDERAETAGL